MSENRSERYEPVLIRYNDPPRVEYVTDDVTTVEMAIDPKFFLLRSMTQGHIIGFRYYLDPGEPA